MFDSAVAFNQDIGAWNTSLVDNMEWMFRNAQSFNQNISDWDTSSVVEMGMMFRVAESFDQDIGGWDVTSVQNMRWMFDGVTLSTDNYDSLLIGWAEQEVQQGVQFDGGDSRYTTGDAAGARDTLVDSYEWEITDGGQVPPGQEP